MTTPINILVTGGKGMLGSALFQEADRSALFNVRAPGHDELDVCDAVAVSSWADWVKDGWIIHCAGRVDVEGCAREPEAARNCIVDGTRNVALLAKQVGAKLLYPQSFLVYDGRKNPIPEDEEPRPLSLYGQLKHEAERVALEHVEDALIIRMAGFFGGATADKNFVGRIIPVMWKALASGQTKFEVGDRVWQPTWTRDLAENTLHLVARGATGRYQMSCVGHATFAQLAHEISVSLGWAGHFKVVSVDASKVAVNELGRRPDVAILSGARLDTEHANLQRPWQSTLNAYLNDPFFDQYRLEPKS
jgi:dTDP-4-dehydrorhamnose reductase